MIEFDIPQKREENIPIMIEDPRITFLSDIPTECTDINSPQTEKDLVPNPDPWQFENPLVLQTIEDIRAIRDYLRQMGDDISSALAA